MSAAAGCDNTSMSVQGYGSQAQPGRSHTNKARRFWQQPGDDQLSSNYQGLGGQEGCAQGVGSSQGCMRACDGVQGSGILASAAAEATPAGAEAAPARPPGLGRGRSSLSGRLRTGPLGWHAAVLLVLLSLSSSAMALSPPDYFCKFVGPGLNNECPLCQSGNACNVSVEMSRMLALFCWSAPG